MSVIHDLLVEMISFDEIIIIYMYTPTDTLGLRQNDLHFPDDT